MNDAPVILSHVDNPVIFHGPALTEDASVLLHGMIVMFESERRRWVCHGRQPDTDEIETLTGMMRQMHDRIKSGRGLAA